MGLSDYERANVRCDDSQPTNAARYKTGFAKSSNFLKAKLLCVLMVKFLVPKCNAVCFCPYDHPVGTLAVACWKSRNMGNNQI